MGVLVIALVLGIGIPKYSEWQAEKIAAEEARRKANLQREMSSFYDLVGKDPQASRIYPSGVTDLHIAAAHGWAKLMQWLIDNGAKVDARLKSDGQKMTPASRRHLSLGSNRWTRGGGQPLHFAAYSDHSEAVEFLLKRGADINARDVIGWTPLHLVAEDGHSDMIESLLKHDADINAKDNHGYPPLDRAIWGKQSKTAEILRRNDGLCNQQC